MSKYNKTYIFKTKYGETLKVSAGTQENATLRLASLVKSVMDWPYVRVIKTKQKHE